LKALGHAVREERQLLEHVLQRAHRAQHRDLLEEVVEGELPLQHPLGVQLGLLLIDDAFEVLHQADDVAKAQDAAGHAFGAELLEPVQAFAHTDVANRRAGDFLHRDRSTAARVTVELGEHDAAERELVVERRRGPDRVLTDHGVDHEQDVLRARALFDLDQLAHQRFVDREPAGGVVDDGVALELARLGLCLGAHFERRNAAHREHRPLAELLQVARQLAGGRRLTGALQTDHHDAGDRGGIDERERLALGLHQRDQLVLADLDEDLARTDPDLLALYGRGALHRLADGLLFDRGEEALDDVELDVRLEQRQPHIAQRLLDVVGRQLGDAG